MIVRSGRPWRETLRPRSPTSCASSRTPTGGSAGRSPATRPATSRSAGRWRETSDKELRGLLAERRELEPELAAKLIDDVSPEVRERLATHTHDPDVITALLADRTARVRKGVARNPRTTAEQRSALAPDPWSTSVPRWCARSSWTRRIWTAWSTTVRCRSGLAMATSEVVPPHIRQALARDADEMVASAARDFRPGPATPPPCGRPASRTGPSAAGRSGGGGTE